MAQFTLPAKYYIDPSYFESELETFFFKRWMAVGRTEQVAKTGDYFLAQVGKESVIVTRSESGEINAFYNVCRHRGTQLCDKPSGTFKGRISCLYHAWNFNLNGQLVAAPHMDGVEGFCLEDYPLKTVHCDQWEGMVWLNFEESPKPLAEQLGSLGDKWKAWDLDTLKLGKRIVYDVKANWKHIVQNYSECLHCPVIHPGLRPLSHYMSGDNEPANERYMGGTMTLNEGIQSLTVTGKTSRHIFPKLDETQKKRVHFYWIAPNMLFSVHPDYLMTHLLWPKEAGRTEIVCEWHFHPEELAKPDFNCEDAVAFWDQVNREDWHVSELSQLGMASRGYVPGPYSHREGLLYGLDQLITGNLV